MFAALPNLNLIYMFILLTENIYIFLNDVFIPKRYQHKYTKSKTACIQNKKTDYCYTCA